MDQNLLISQFHPNSTYPTNPNQYGHGQNADMMTQHSPLPRPLGQPNPIPNTNPNLD